MQKHSVQEIFSVINKAQELGYRELASGTKLVGRTPHVAPEAWLHLLFPPISNTDILELEKMLRIKVPDEYRSFLTKFANGLGLFSDCLSLHGLRRNYSRSGDEMWQPFGLADRNLYERPRDASINQFFVGSYSEDGSLLYIESTKVYRCKRESVKPLNEWPSFCDMLVTEVKRLSLHFDNAGRKRDAHRRITP